MIQCYSHAFCIYMYNGVVVLILRVCCCCFSSSAHLFFGYFYQIRCNYDHCHRSHSHCNRSLATVLLWSSDLWEAIDKLNLTNLAFVAGISAWLLYNQTLAHSGLLKYPRYLAICSTCWSFTPTLVLTVRVHKHCSFKCTFDSERSRDPISVP